MALSVVYFRIMHRLGRQHYVWDEYLYSVREKVEVMMTVSVVPVHSLLFSKSTKGAARLNVPSDGRIAINRTICLLNIHSAEGFGI